MALQGGEATDWISRMHDIIELSLSYCIKSNYRSRLPNSTTINQITIIRCYKRREKLSRRRFHGEEGE